jgi:hypothetical protein
MANDSWFDCVDSIRYSLRYLLELEKLPKFTYSLNNLNE